MSRGRSEFIVGLFTLVVLGVAAYIILAIQGNPFQENFHLLARYNRVGGVRAGTPVSLAGHQIGEVDKVKPKPELRKVEVQMAIAKEYEGAILSDATATIVPVGFLGDVMVELSYGRYGVPVKDGDVLEGGEPLDWQRVIKGAAGDFSATMRSVDKVVGNPQYQEDLGKILDNLSKFTDTLNGFIVPEDKGELRGMMTSLKDMGTRIGDAADSLRNLVDENHENVTASFSNARTITDQVKAEVAPEFAQAAKRFSDLGTQMSALTEKIDKFIEANSTNASDAITGIKDSTKALRETLDSAKTSLDQIKEGPGSLHDLVYKDETIRELNSTLRSARGFFDMFSGLGSGLDLKISAEAKWFFADPTSDHSRTDFHTVITNPPPGADFRGYSEAWTPADQNRGEWDIAGQVFFGDYGVLLGVDDVGAQQDLDLLFLGKIPSSGGRLVAGFGILEGEAGARLEAHLIPDLLYLRMDGIGFSSRDKERLDVSLRAQLWENISVLGGVESVVGAPDRRFFAGMRLEFGKKFGEKKDESSTEPEEPPGEWVPESSTSEKKKPSSENPFEQDEAIWSQKQKGQPMIPAEEAPSRKVPGHL
jgi:phospholipid/cholesterol/gamma-HCH transport system substrate-binding protein